MPKMTLTQAAATALWGCIVLVTQSCAHEFKCSSVAEAFVQRPLKEQLSTFTAHSLEEQYAIYLCGTQAVHPPLIHLAEPLASDGKGAVGFLQAKLANAQDDATIQDIIMVFAAMSRQHNYNVAADPDLMQIVNASVARMKDDGWKRFSAQKVAEISQSHW